MDEALLGIEELIVIRDFALFPPTDLLFSKAVFNTGSDSCLGEPNMGIVLLQSSLLIGKLLTWLNKSYASSTYNVVSSQNQPPNFMTSDKFDQLFLTRNCFSLSVFSSGAIEVIVLL